MQYSHFAVEFQLPVLRIRSVATGIKTPDLSPQGRTLKLNGPPPQLKNVLLENKIIVDSTELLLRKVY